LTTGTFETILYITVRAKREGFAMNKFVFFGAAEGEVLVSIDQQPVGSAATAEDLARILMINGVSTADDIYTSSSIDFCEEEGFESGAALEMIDAAFDIYGDKEVDIAAG
jgi:hypothetical protein